MGMRRLVAVGLSVVAFDWSGAALAQEVDTADPTNVPIPRPSLPEGVGKQTDLGSEWTTKLSGAVTVGAGVRTRAQKPTLKLGGGNNSDDGNINYAKDDIFSEIIKAYAKVDVQNRSGTGVVLSGMAWYDYNLNHHSVPHGNNPNNFLPGTLSDQGFDRQARFDGIELLDSYAYGKSEALGGPLDWRIGRLSVARDAGFSFTGGLRDLDARNTAASTRPGALAEEGVLPFWGTTARWAVTPALRLEGFLQFAQQKSIGPGCGTFFATNDYTPEGCNRVFYDKTVTERANVVRGTFIPRADDITPTNRPDQLGVNTSYLFESVGTRVSASYAHYHSRNGYTSVIKGRTLGPFTGAQYEIEYPADKNLFALTTSTRIASQQLIWINELSVISNQPLQLNPSSLLAGFLRGDGPLAADAIAQRPNTLYHGYDRFRVIQLQTGALKEFGAVLGATRTYVGAEVAIKHVVGLPDRAKRPYSRPEIDDVCSTDAECATLDGFVTSNAWGYRVRAGMDFPNVASSSITLRPSVTFAQDVRGWSYDYGFVQDRKSIRLSLDADLTRGVFGNLTYAASRGGLFNTRKDRDFSLASIGFRF